MPLYRTILFTAVCTALTAAAGAQEWTRFRGPNGSGTSDATTIPASWGEDDYLWKTALPGVGHSSPVVWGEHVFLTSADPQTGNRYVLCVATDDGRLMWKRELSAKTYHIHQQNSLASSTPTVDAERVYCAFATPEEFSVQAFDHDGQPAWQANLGPFVSAHGFGTSPILFEDLLIITNDQDADSFLVALDRAGGQTRWKTPRQAIAEQNACYAAPCLYEPANGPAELILCSRAHGISSVDPRSGKINWETPVLERRPVGSPIVVGDLILANCGEGSGNHNVVAIRPGAADGREPQLVYKIGRANAPYVPSLVARGQLVFLWGDRGVVTCIDGGTGSIHWQQRVGGNYSSSPVIVGDRVYGVSSEGEVVTIAAADKYELLGRSTLGEGTRATPAVAGGRMFLRTEGHLFAVGRK